MWRTVRILLFTACLLPAQTAIFPLAEVRPNQQGVARSVFSGSQPEEFPLRILGVLSQSGPGQSLILARLLTERLEHTGVMQGMSGSPIYIDGRLAGAIAFSFPFAKEPIAGIRPIEEMLAAGALPASTRPLQAAHLHLGSDRLVPFPPEEAGLPNSPRRVIGVRFAGITEACARAFASQWNALGFSLSQQSTGGSRPGATPEPVAPGDMISVQLMRGDMVAGADGTVTYVNGDRIGAFGHRFLAGGDVDFPFAKAEVITPLASWNTPFKISQSLAPAGSITLDSDAGVSGVLGRAARLAPLRLRYREAGREKTYSMEIVRHTVLSPLLLQMAIFSAIDHHFRAAGSGTVSLRGSISFAGLPPLQVDSLYSGDANLSLGASLGAAIPLAYLLQQTSSGLLPDALDFEVELTPNRQQWVIDRLQPLRRQAKPGDVLPLRLALSNPDGQERQFTVDFPVPAWLSPGETLTITASDATTTNLLDFRPLYQPGGPVFPSPKDLIAAVNRLHPANAFYVRVFRSGAAYSSQSVELSNLPLSVAGAMQRNAGAFQPSAQSRLFDREVRLPDSVVGGNRTITIEVEK